MAPRDAGSTDGRKFQVIADDLRTEIADGVHRAGGQLPSQRELQATYGVSRETVGRALEVLRDEGLISSSRGRPATVTGGPVPAAAAQPAQVTLQPRLRAAFEAEEITMDVLSLTSETMAQHLGAQVARISDGDIRPHSISLRLMLPDITGIRLAFPRGVEDPDDDRPRKRHRDMVINHARSLRHSLLRLRHQGLVPEVSVQIRTVPFTPPLKLYLLNKDQLLEGYYTLEQWTPEPIDGVEVTILDSLGVGATLFPYTKPAQALKVEAAQKFFDSYWDQLAQDADFGD
ncbi:GntR family transcriptional regulator [Streptomyces sp. NBC_00859]|uniref:GntR family transcriptional regulator n=1 Tax=Streptomyces sp. NBC_00859 TaxID=2903682 RepID=UPI003869D02A|nr:GntR family transcriptional regulator [Streptomyces sp. NBC_00859]